MRSVEGNSASFYHTDALGSVRMLTDTTGLVSDTYTYDAYGISLSNSDVSYQFAGERRDTETGLDYLRARYYDPELGRFISKDAFGGFLNDPMSQGDWVIADDPTTPGEIEARQVLETFVRSTDTLVDLEI